MEKNSIDIQQKFNLRRCISTYKKEFLNTNESIRNESIGNESKRNSLNEDKDNIEYSFKLKDLDSEEYIDLIKKKSFLQSIFLNNLLGEESFVIKENEKKEIKSFKRSRTIKSSHRDIFSSQNNKKNFTPKIKSTKIDYIFNNNNKAKDPKFNKLLDSNFSKKINNYKDLIFSNIAKKIKSNFLI